MSINHIFAGAGVLLLIFVAIAAMQTPPPPRRGQPPRKKKKGVLVFTGLLGVFVVAFSLLYDPTKGTMPACGLVAAADTEAEFGWKLLETRGSTSPAGDATYCSYKLDSTQQPKTLDLFVGACKPDTLSLIRKEPQAFEVSELGDEAVSSGATLITRKGGNCYSLAFEEPDIDAREMLPKRKALLRKIMTRPIPSN